MFTISRMTPSNIESSIFTQQRFEVGRVLRVVKKKKGKKMRKGGGYTGGLVS